MWGWWWRQWQDRRQRTQAERRQRGQCVSRSAYAVIAMLSVAVASIPSIAGAAPWGAVTLPLAIEASRLHCIAAAPGFADTASPVIAFVIVVVAATPVLTPSEVRVVVVVQQTLVLVEPVASFNSLSQSRGSLSRFGRSASWRFPLMRLP